MSAARNNHGEHKLVMTRPTSVEQPKNETWHSHSAVEVLAQLGAAATGLAATAAAQRLAANGPNEIKEGKRVSPFPIFLGQFKILIIWILIAASVISGVLGKEVPIGQAGQKE